MIERPDDRTRHIIPQWLRARDPEAIASALPATQGSSRPQANSDSPNLELARIRSDWDQHRGLGFATELVSAATIHREPEIAYDAASFILDQPQVPHSAQRLAQSVLGTDQVEAGSPAPSEALLDKTGGEARSVIRRGRRLMRLVPENPAVWTEMARAFAILGRDLDGERAMLHALRFAPDNRSVLRAAARLFQLHGDPMRSVQMLRRRTVTRHDPWLVAAEVAISHSLGQGPRMTRSGRELLSSGDFLPFHTSELAGALATLELEHGRDRHARKLFQQALVHPTRNAIAQAAWAERTQKLDIGEGGSLHAPGRASAAEARFWTEYGAMQWNAAVGAALEWLVDEPFSTRPVLAGTDVASILLGDWQLAEDILVIGLRADPDDTRLLLQAAYIYGTQGKIEPATRALTNLRSASLSDRQRVVRTANEGLLAYRLNRPEVGREKYATAVATAVDKIGDRLLTLNAVAHFAREEQRVNGPFATDLLRQVQQLRSVSSTPELDIMIARDLGLITA